eukprot:3252670-Pyramimonas_sp.AAC.1
MDTVTDFYDSPHTARGCVWDKTLTGAMSFVISSSALVHDTVVGCAKSRRGISGVCATAFENPRLHGVSGVMPYSADRGLDSINIAAALGQSADANEGSAEGDFANIAVPAELDPEDAEVE